MNKFLILLCSILIASCSRISVDDSLPQKHADAEQPPAQPPQPPEQPKPPHDASLDTYSTLPGDDNTKEFKAEWIFRIDNCNAYRFWDAGEWRFFQKCW